MINKIELLTKIESWINGYIDNDTLEDYLDWLDIDEEDREPDGYIKDVVTHANQFNPDGIITTDEMKYLRDSLKHYIKTGERLRLRELRSINKKELENVIKLPLDKKYNYFIKIVANYRCLFAFATQKDWGLVEDDGEQLFFPVWPHPIYAENYLQETYSEEQRKNFNIKEISLEEFINEILPKMEENNILINVMLAPDGSSVVCEPKKLIEDLKEYLYEAFSEEW